MGIFRVCSIARLLGGNPLQRLPTRRLIDCDEGLLALEDNLDGYPEEPSERVLRSPACAVDSERSSRD